MKILSILSVKLSGSKLQDSRYETTKNDQHSDDSYELNEYAELSTAPNESSKDKENPENSTIGIPMNYIRRKSHTSLEYISLLKLISSILYHERYFLQMLSTYICKIALRYVPV